MGRDFDYEILSVMRWVRRELVADRYGTDRVFIAGDAAHLMSPTGGFGMNTGIQDSVDLGWKLEATVRGWGGQELLRSYEIERRPVAIRNVTEASGNLGRMLSTRQRRPPPEIFRAGRGGRRRPQGVRRLVHRNDEAGVVHARLPSRLPLRRLADRLAGRHAGAAARDRDLYADRAAGRARAARLAAGRALDPRPVRPRLHAAARWARMRRGGERLRAAAAAGRRAVDVVELDAAARHRALWAPARAGSSRRARGVARRRRAARTRARSSTSCAGRAAYASHDGKPTKNRTRRPMAPPPTPKLEEIGHEPGHPRALLRRAGAAELLARLGAAGARDVGVAEAEIQAGGVAVRGRQVGARPGRRVRPGRAGRAPQPDHGQSDRRQHLRDQPQHRRRLPDGEGGRDRALAPPHRGGAAPGGAGQARHLHGGRRRPRRHGAGRRGADAVLVLARPRQRERRHQLLDRLPRRAVRAAFGGDVLRAQPGGLREDHPQRPSPFRIPAREALGPGNDAKEVEIAKGVLPTIGLHLLRLPSGTRRRGAEDHRQQSLLGDQRQGARHHRGRKRTKISRSAT